MIRRASGTRPFNIYKLSEVFGMRSMEKVISKRNYFVVHALFRFEPVPRFEYRGDYVQLLGFQLMCEQGRF